MEENEQLTAEETAEQPAEEQTAAEAAEVTDEAADGAADAPAEITDEAAIAAATVFKKPIGDKVLTKEQKRKRLLLRILFLHAGIILMSLSVYFFQTPNRFTLGGVAGIAILLANYIPLSQAIIMLIINVFLIILGLIILGKQCTILTIYCSLLYTGIIALFEQVIPLSHPLTDQPFLEMVYAVLLFGVGGAIIFYCGASSGGTDIIALILKKFTRINVGMALMIIDTIVICVSIVTFNSVSIALYSFLGLFVKSFLLDGVIESFGKTKYITIITTQPEQIGDYILNVIQHGYTLHDAEGGYTHEKKKVLITVCKRGEALKLKYKVKQIDPTSFVIITDANEILGKGFGGAFL